MQRLLKELQSYEMLVNIHTDFSNSPEIVYFRFHKNNDKHYFLHGLIIDNEFILHKKIGIHSTYTNLGKWRHLSHTDFLIIQDEYKKMAEILLYN